MIRRPECLAGLALACAAAALAACGLVPREERSEGPALSRTYAVDMQSLASCALERLGRKYGKIEKTDFPDRYMVRLRREANLITYWDINLVAADQDSTRVAVIIPPKIGNVQPEQLLADVESCTAPQPGATRAPG
jgi:hypothetical protein